MLSSQHPPIPEATSDEEHAAISFDFGFGSGSSARRPRFGLMPYKNQVLAASQMNGRATLTAIHLPPDDLSAADTSNSSKCSETTRNGVASSVEQIQDESTSAISTSSCGAGAEGEHDTPERLVSAASRCQCQINSSVCCSSSPNITLHSAGTAQAYSALTSLQRITSTHCRPNHQIVTRPLLNVLSRETFLDILENPPVRHRLQKFTQTSLCCEFVSFLDQIRYHKKIVSESAKIMADIDAEYLSPSSDSHIDLSSPAHEDLRADINTVVKETYPSIGSIFDDCEEAIQTAIFECVYPDFVRAQIALSASEALSSNRHRYQGLGDCFCLTDPRKADNPITFASDGFVAVTGYERKEVIPRNCRFLQGRQTDNHAIRRIGNSVRNTCESVEFLLNYRKNGEPFWNLLYTAPLIDAHGKVVFFLGGQVNCSSSIHGKPDIMRVLATSPDHDDDTSIPSLGARITPSTNLIRRVDRIRALKYRQHADVEEEPGIERRLIAANQNSDQSTRIERFYNAYSKYLVLTYPSPTITFSSQGIHDILDLDDTTNDTTTTTTTAPMIGSNIFKFLRRNMLSKDKSDWKHRVEVALRTGKPISVKVNLRTKRSRAFRGDEKFLTHWTPLKDEEGKVGWVIVCLCGCEG